MIELQLIPPLKTVDWENIIPLCGILAVLYVLDILEKDEEFEECIRIRDAIERRREFSNIPTKLTDEAIDQVLDSWHNIGKGYITREYVIDSYKNSAMYLLLDLGYKLR